MRILVLQTTRMGDVLQTSPLVRTLRREHPEAHIALAVRAMGRPIAERIPDVDEIITINDDEFLADMVSGDSDRLLRAYERAEAALARLRNARFDRAYNVTHSIASALMLKIAGIREVTGAHVSDDGVFNLRGPWTTYFFTSVFHRDYNDLNLCDIIRSFAASSNPCRELVFEVRGEDQSFATSLLRQHGIGESDFVAAFQLGASEEGKRWSAAHFAGLAQLLREKYAAKILLLGVKEEAGLGEEFSALAPGLGVPLYGKTSVPQAAALLQRARVLVTNDTGTMHIAAAVKCPVVLVSVGHVHYRETGPYGEGHCAIEWRRKSLGHSGHAPEGEASREKITPEQVLAGVEIVVNGGQVSALAAESGHLDTVDLQVTRFAPDGYLEFYPALRRPLTERDLVRIAGRAMWLEHLGAAGGEMESVREMLRHYTVEADEAAVWHERLNSAFGELAALAARGAATTRTLIDVLRRKRGMEQAKPLASQLTALDESIRIHAELHPPCRPLALMARFERDNLEGLDPLMLAETTLGIYEACEARARLFIDKLQNVLAEAQNPAS